MSTKNICSESMRLDLLMDCWLMILLSHLYEVMFFVFFCFFLFLFIKFQILFCKCLSVPLVPYFTSTDSQKKFEISDVRNIGCSIFWDHLLYSLKRFKKGLMKFRRKMYSLGFFYFSSVQLWTLELKPATFKSFHFVNCY